MLAVALLAMSVAVVLAGEKVEEVEPTRAEKIEGAVQKAVDEIDIDGSPNLLAQNVCADVAVSEECDTFAQIVVDEVANGKEQAVIDQALRGVFLERVQDVAVKRDIKIEELENLGAEDNDETILAEVSDLIDEQTIALQIRATRFATATEELAAHDAFVTSFDAAVAASEARIADFNRILEIGVELDEKIKKAVEDEEDFAGREALQKELDDLLVKNEAQLTAIGNALPKGSGRFEFAQRIFDAAVEQALLFETTEDADNLLSNKVRLTHVVQDDLVDLTELAATYPDVEYELVAGEKKRAEAVANTYEANCASNLNLEEDELELCKQQLAQFIGDSKKAFSTVLVLDVIDLAVAEAAELDKGINWKPDADWESTEEKETDPYAKSSDDHKGHDHSESEEEEDSATLASLSLSLLSLVGLRSLF